MEHIPYLVSWNLTRRCNLLCPHCYIDSNPPHPSFPKRGKEELNSELTIQETKSVVDELSHLNPRLMLILSGGEPMLRDDIEELLEHAAGKGFIVVVGSNGTLLSEDRLRGLKLAGLKGLGVSIDSTTPSYHDAFRGVEGAWESSLKAIKTARTLGLEVQMDVTLTDGNVGQVRELVELGALLSVKSINFFFLICTGRATKAEITTDHYDSALRTIAELFRTETRLMVRARCAPHLYRLLYESGFPLQVGTTGCLAGKSYLRIDPEGNITPCPYLPVSVGNVRQESVATLWMHSPILRQMREGSYKGRCGICEYAELCGGCRARALAERSDLMEEDPLCAHLPSGEGKVCLEEAFSSTLLWDLKAKERMRKVPVFMKGMVIRMIERKAIEKGVSNISSEFIDEVKSGAIVH
ncbi:MAG: radical SAM protein [Thermodesulfobacteriota bacterium]|nr:radical SAM protein [Thermodesulfobacteriota bacterium]